MNGGLLDDRIPELLRQVDLVALVSERAGEPARFSGGTRHFHCPNPQHPDRHPSFTVKDGRYKCWSACGASGDAIDLLVWLDSLTVAEAIEKLCRRVGLDRPTAPRGCNSISPGEEQRMLAEYLEGRNLPAELAIEFDLSVVVDRYGHPRVRHPFRFRGIELGWQDRSLSADSTKRWLSSPGPMRCPYEADRLDLGRERGKVLVVEGVSDVLAVCAAFENPAVVGIPGATGFKAPWAAAFDGLDVRVIPDNDPAGGHFVRDVAGKLAGHASSVWQLAVPQPYKDVSEWLVGVCDRETFALQLESAEVVAERLVPR